MARDINPTMADWPGGIGELPEARSVAPEDKPAPATKPPTYVKPRQWAKDAPQSQALGNAIKAMGR